jgi:hypothetical protein
MIIIRCLNIVGGNCCDSFFILIFDVSPFYALVYFMLLGGSSCYVVCLARKWGRRRILELQNGSTAVYTNDYLNI